MTDRRNILDQIKTWTAHGITVNGEEDQKLLQKFYDDNPEFKQAALDGARDRQARLDLERELEWRRRQDPGVLERMRQMQEHIAKTKASLSVGGAATAANPQRMSAAIEAFVKSKTSSAANSARTLQDKKRLLLALCEHVGRAFPNLTSDPWVHELQSNHLSSFVDAAPVRKHRKDTELVNGVAPIAAATATKKISDLRSFFSYAQKLLKATSEDASGAFTDRVDDLKSNKSRQKNSYKPFNDAHLRLIFEPRTYLAFNRAADYFWAPLLGVHLGCRLGEIVTMRLESIERDEETGIWSLQVEDERAKNENSVRRLPLPDRLIELGFREYVKRVRELGAVQLFPHRDLTNPTAKLDPSKRCSEQFGEYLDSIKIVDGSLVFHSFRHTVVTALQDGNTPLGDSMQIVGHASQELAISARLVTQQQIGGVHVNVYGHANSSRMNVADPLARLKGHLDRCITPPLDYATLRKAADIVLEHVTKTPDGFKSGWPKLKQSHTHEMLSRLE